MKTLPAFSRVVPVLLSCGLLSGCCCGNWFEGVKHFADEVEKERQAREQKDEAARQQCRVEFVRLDEAPQEGVRLGEERAYDLVVRVTNGSGRTILDLEVAARLYADDGGFCGVVGKQSLNAIPAGTTEKTLRVLATDLTGRGHPSRAEIDAYVKGFVN
ncbi:MAG: hypothetical protein HY720_24475 [Planctomycetes bacterium]|nr:hypothetical protein [Planctomycetota bacterium]